MRINEQYHVFPRLLFEDVGNLTYIRLPETGYFYRKYNSVTRVLPGLFKEKLARIEISPQGVKKHLMPRWRWWARRLTGY